MAKVKFFIRTTQKNKDASLRVRFYHGKSFDLTANLNGKQINPNFWNNKSGTVRHRAEFKESETFARELDDIRAHIINQYNTASDKSKINKEWLEKTIDTFYNPNKYLQDGTSLFGFIKNFTKNSKTRINPKTGNPVCYKMRREYEVTFEYLKNFAKQHGEPDFIDIDLEFYQQFVDFLRKKGLATNTIGKKIQTLKIFLNAATEQGINPYQKYKSKNFSTLTEESDNIYLTKEELKKFYNHDFSENKRLEKVRDIFIVGSWTGLRFSDLQQITPDKIQGDYIEIRQNKTGKKVTIPVHYTVRNILQKYKGKLPEPISNQKFNDYLKEAAKEAKINTRCTKKVIEDGLRVEKSFHKHQLISSHTARRSFCTNGYLDEMPTLAIMSISGHRTEKAFLKYIKADGKQHAKKVLDAWRNSGDFMDVAN